MNPCRKLPWKFRSIIYHRYIPFFRFWPSNVTYLGCPSIQCVPPDDRFALGRPSIPSQLYFGILDEVHVKCGVLTTLDCTHN